MLYDFILEEELEQMRRSEKVRDERPHLELPLYMPYWPEPEKEAEDDNESERGVIIIQM